MACSADFNPSTYKPDGRVFAQLPRKGAQDFMSEEQEHLAVDLVWLDAHANPEPSLGDYLPSGLPLRLGCIFDQLVPSGMAETTFADPSCVVHVALPLLTAVPAPTGT